MPGANHFVFGLVSTLTLLCCSWAQNDIAPAEVSIALEKATITKPEPVILNIRIRNPYSKEVNFDPGYDWEDIEIKVVGPDGHPYERLREPLQEGMKFSNAVRIPAASVATVSLLASEWFNFREEGVYEMDVVLRKLPSKPSARNFIVRLKIEPRDEGALRAACSDLLANVNNAHSFASSLVAAKALSGINDPVAVPYLAAAMKKPEFMSLMIGALARLNTKASVDALIDASKSQDPEMSNLALSALASLRH
jgi:hypothetical protein